MKSSESMSSLDEDIQYIFQLTRWALKPLGLWWIIAEEERQMMLEKSKFGKKITKLCAFFIFSGGYAFTTIMPLWNRHVNKKKGLVKPAPPSIYDHLFNTQATPAREIIFGIRLLGSTICYIVITAACGLAAMSASHISGHVDIIKSRLQKLVDCKYETEHDMVNDKIAFIIQCHVKIISFSGRVEKMLREICLIEVLSSTFLICWLGYYCMMKWNDNEPVSILTYTILLISLTLNIFIFCYIGEILQEQCASIGNFTYMSDWYKISGKKILSLLLIIAMANYPRRITACGFMDLNIRSFGSIMKTSVAYLNMLRAMAE
ncbi:odorant receptor 22c-like [Chelonus insularis]|uniref:odorant receptor 22c-like n=1 Tax=Chelonus insularis TaxID=460826 RepID=UPI00158CE55E|nr:odorant receptor 22c-like [Chelonus insularis]